MSEIPTRRIYIEVPGGAGSTELDLALDGLRILVEAAGGQMFDRQIKHEVDPTDDDDLRLIAAGVETMRAIGLLDPDKQIKDLVIGHEPPQRLWDATGYKGLNRTAVNDFAHTMAYGEKIVTIPALLALVDFSGRMVGDKKSALLRQALIDSGMPEEFPWPYKYTFDNPEGMLRCLMLIAPTFDELPNVSKARLAHIFGVTRIAYPSAEQQLTDSQLQNCRARYAERRREVLAIVGRES
jgi:hypothetical protein